ncbi:conserved hypothetical protein [Methanocella paludicola SANAE]|uniref:Radical SAM core domain-containing protein n=1 Tax=Methanocella paludicola (strain DSM 17711 / JCM 13418 / NBRC 101707 / SANAE) TaxID=304371 RepID=D1YX53_METPS|nr:radical SAM protein [Methanocella paludicola]BAI61025.1 conserved hypothetical protein [Methanocella paludicola SANAE]
MRCNSYTKLSDSAYKLTNLIRISKPITKIFGPEYTTSLDNIEIDITFKCNLKCYNCDRSCTQAPSELTMSLEQIRKFIDESISNDKHWSRIRVLGGEPTLHPDIDKILKILLDYKENYSPTTWLELTTNNFGPEVNRKLLKVPRKIYVNNTRKMGRFQKKFEAFNLAPCDNRIYAFTDFTNACWITNDCGMGLNRYGYYQCGAAGSIDRVFGMNIGLKKLPVYQSEFYDQKTNLCSLCGHFARRRFVPGNLCKPVNGEPKSNRWILAYENYSKQPTLSLY